MILTVDQFCFDPLANEISKGAAQGRTTAVFVGLVAVVGELVNIPHVEGLMPSTSQPPMSKQQRHLK
jgi:hypothetical protein